MKRVGPIFTLLAALSLIGAAPAGTRRYSDGPLTVDDYQAAVPDNAARDVFTYVRLNWDLRYEYSMASGQVAARLSHVELFAVVDRDASWMRRKDTSRLEFEQGHFDLTQRLALELTLKYRQKIRQQQGLVGKGKNKEAAGADVQRRLEEELTPIFLESRKEHDQYEESTLFGRNAKALAEQRREQRAAVERLTRELEDPRRAKGGR